MLLSREVDLGPGDIPLDGDPAPPLKEAGAQQPPTFRPTYCGQTAGWIKVPFGMEVGLPQANCVRWTQLPLPKKGGGHSSPQFSAHVFCVQTAICIRIPLGLEVGVSRGDIVLDGDPAPLP